MAADQKDNVTVRTDSMENKARKAWGPEYDKSDIAYEFSNERKFESTDRSESGVYRK